MLNDKELIVLVGCPGAGKSTLAIELMRERPNTIRINRDNIRKSIHSDNDKPYLLDHRLSQVMAREALACGYSPIMDNTNTKRDDIEYIRQLSKEFNTPIVWYVFRTPVVIAKHRNKLREDKSPVPEEVIDRMDVLVEAVFKDLCLLSGITKPKYRECHRFVEYGSVVRKG